MLLDQWAAPAAYEQYMGRWSQRLAPRFLQWLQAPPGVHWLDVGCGTGALSAAVCSEADPASVLGCDPSEPFIEYARAHVADPRAQFVVAEASDLPEREGGYDRITSLLALNFFPDPGEALRRMASLMSGPHAQVSACVWDYGEQTQMLDRFWHAAAAVDPRAHEHSEARRFPMCKPPPWRSCSRRRDCTGPAANRCGCAPSSAASRTTGSPCSPAPDRPRPTSPPWTRTSATSWPAGSSRPCPGAPTAGSP